MTFAATLLRVCHQTSQTVRTGSTGCHLSGGFTIDDSHWLTTNQRATGHGASP